MVTMGQLLTKQERIALRVMDEIRRRHLTNARVGQRIGWTEAYVAMRLGLAMPGRVGGRVALTSSELELFAKALRVQPSKFLDPPEHVVIVDPAIPAGELLELAS